MAKAIPLYVDHEAKHQADACRVLSEAADAGTIRVSMMSGGHYPGKPVLKRSFPGLKMVGVWDAPHEQQWSLPWHRNEGIELTFLERGKLSFETDEGEFSLQPNDLTIMRPWQQHRLGNPSICASRLHWLLIDVGVRRPHQVWKWPSWLFLSKLDMAELSMLLRQNERAVWKGTAELLRAFQGIAQCIETDVNGSSFSRLALRLNELFLVLLETLRQKNIRLDESLTSSMRSVQLFLADLQSNGEHLALPWTVHKMAQACGLGATQFIHHVKSLTNMTPQHYLTHYRIERAEKLLRLPPSAGITETAMDCGFSSSQYFATVFAKQVGCAPREYRSRYRPQ